MAEMQQIIRVGETDLDGEKPVKSAVRRIKGVSFMMANHIMKDCPFADKKVGELSESELKQLESIVMGAAKNAPAWMLNRRKDPSNMENRHIITSQLDFVQKNDINEMKKMRTYKGVRHSSGLPVRGQRTRSSFRTGGTVGVKREKAKPGAAPASGDKK